MRHQLPRSGRPWPAIRAEFDAIRAGDVRWRDGRASVYVFHPGEDVLEVAHEAYGAFISENGLGPAAFPSLKQMEAEVVEMALSLQRSPDGAAGSMTSGGTESIIMAMKACRDWSRTHRPVDGKPAVVVPRTAHPAFNKGGHYLGLDVIRVPTSDGFIADPGAMAAAITPSTIMMVGSAPCFPFGVTDPIEALADVAVENRVWLHVDACVGGYIAPFVRMLGEAVTNYDFSVEGVASMSADLHKYGYAAKGASTVMYRDQEKLAAQGFHFDDWPSGHMFTPTMAGTRPGGAIAAAWAVMNYLGEEGYCQRARQILDTRLALTAGVTQLGFRVYGSPELSLMTFGNPDLDVLAIGKGLYQEGWVSSRTNEPPGIHLMISPAHRNHVAEYLGALARWTEQARAGALSPASRDVRYS